MSGWEAVGGRILLGVTGLSSGVLVAGGVVALMVGLGIIRRFIGISHTASRVRIYENAICLGGIAGNLMTVFYPTLLVGAVGTAITGLFFGIFVGGWIMALAELLNVYPVFVRRLGLVKGTCFIVYSLAAGKVLGSLMIFYLESRG